MRTGPLSRTDGAVRVSAFSFLDEKYTLSPLQPKFGMWARHSSLADSLVQGGPR